MFGLLKSKSVDAVSSLVEKTGSAFDELFTSDEERNAAKIVMQKISQKPAEWAHQLNLINANSGSWWDSGWRPAFGWVGAVAAFLYYVPQYVMASYLWMTIALEADAANGLPAYPVSDDGLWQLVALLLGGAVTRSHDKLRGIAKS